MKYLKTYRLYESEDRTKSVIDRVSARRDTAKANVNEYVKRLSDLISINYEIYDIDENAIMECISRYSTGTSYDKKKANIPYVDVCGDSGLDNTGRVSSIILSFGYSVGYFSASQMGMDIDIMFSDFVSDIFKTLHFEKVSNNKLPRYTGPDVISPSITATSFGTKKQIDDIDDMIERYYDGDEERGEISVMIGCLYQYGYGYGNDAGYIVNLKSITDMSRFLPKSESKDFIEPGDEVKFLPAYEIQREEIEATIEDILVDINDEGFETHCNSIGSMKEQSFEIRIERDNKPFEWVDVKDVLNRVYEYMSGLNKNLSFSFETDDSIRKFVQWKNLKKANDAIALNKHTHDDVTKIMVLDHQTLEIYFPVYYDKGWQNLRIYFDIE